MKPLVRIAIVVLLGGCCSWTQAAEGPEKGAYAGWAVLELDPAVHDQKPALGGAGLEVVELDPEGPAAKANVQVKDILLQLDEQRLFTAGQLRALLRTLAAGDAHRLLVSREDTTELLDLRLAGPRPRAQSTAELRTVWVPFDRWNSNTNWSDGLEDLLQEERPGVDPLASEVLPRSVAMLFVQEAPAWARNVGAVILLQRESVEPAAPAEPAGLSFPELVPDGNAGAGNSELGDEQGSIEVTQRGGRDYVTVRDAQGAVLYEGRMESENDLLLLRPLRPALRQAVEASLGAGTGVGPPVEIEALQLKIPPQVF